MKKAICFGAGGNGFRLFDKISEKYNIIFYTDNNSDKWGTKVHGLSVIEPAQVIKTQFDVLVITSMPGLDNITKQMIDLGIDEYRIDSSFVTGPLESRRIFLQNLSYLQSGLDKEYSVAEAGVFEGDFAKYINEYYSDRRLHLFDTFSGFDERDISKEGNYSTVKTGDYDNTSEDSVMKKMKYPEKIVLHKGYFPDTAQGINERFCFVNLDMDLYEPTYQGLAFFSKRMCEGGAILIHDYFSTDFYGPSKAVNKFIIENKGKYYTYPIGDGISILVTGF